MMSWKYYIILLRQTRWPKKQRIPYIDECKSSSRCSNCNLINVTLVVLAKSNQLNDDIFKFILTYFGLKM